MVRKKWLATGLALAALAVVLAAGCTPVGSPITGDLSGQQEGVWVTGQGKISVSPDVVDLALEVEAQEATVSEAQSLAAAAMSQVMAALGSVGIAPEDIETRQFSIHRVTRFDRDEEEPVVIGFRVSNHISARIRNIDQAGAVIDAAVEAGGDLIRIDSISFSVDEPETYYEALRELAMADAVARAEQLAELGGIRLGKPTFISETTPVAPPVPLAFESARSLDTSTPISPGDTDITITVQVVYSIR
jgi:uncharacterized protein YggE